METGSHLQRMSCYCALIAERLGLDTDLIRIAGRLHDVGMAAVSHAVTGKPGPLTPSERRELEAHPALGHAMLTGSGVELLETAAEIALTHHERFDGAGYPRGLAGEEIPIAGRIAAVADTFDALTTDRVYRSAGSIEQAVETLNAERGRHLDPRVVDAFLEALDEAVEIRAHHPPAPDEQPAMVPEDKQITLQAAAATLAISPSRLRRWADEGRISSVRTAGGHRRFSLSAVRRLAAENGVRPAVRPVEPPATPLPILAENLRAHGRQLGAAAGDLPRRTARVVCLRRRGRPPDGLDGRRRRELRHRRLRARAAGHDVADAARPGPRREPARAPRVPRALRPGVRAHARAHGRRA
jgi:excisionase family DNA binding protein